MTDLSIPIMNVALVIFSGALSYVYLLNRLVKFIQPIRLKLADEGVSLLRSEELRNEERRFVIYCLTNAYSVQPAIVAAVVFPFIAIWSLARVIGDRIRGKSRIPAKVALARIFLLFGCSTMAASPIFGLVLGFEFLVFVVAVVLTTGQLEALRMVLTPLAKVEEMIASRMPRFAR